MTTAEIQEIAKGEKLLIKNNIFEVLLCNSAYTMTSEHNWHVQKRVKGLYFVFSKVFMKAWCEEQA